MDQPDLLSGFDGQQVYHSQETLARPAVLAYCQLTPVCAIAWKLRRTVAKVTTAMLEMHESLGALLRGLITKHGEPAAEHKKGQSAHSHPARAVLDTGALIALDRGAKRMVALRSRALVQAGFLECQGAAMDLMHDRAVQTVRFRRWASQDERNLWNI